MNQGAFPPRRTRRSLSAAMILLSLCAVALPYATKAQRSRSRDSTRSDALRDPSHKLWSEPAPDVFEAEIVTTKGSFIIEAHRDWAPLGTDRFYHLVETGFFNDSRFFRVRAGFIVQFGIPGSPAIAGVWLHHAMADDPPRQSNVLGTVAYAMTGPNTRTTQLYFNLADNSRLDSQGFAPIGKVIRGMEVVGQLYSGYGEDSGGGMRLGKQDKLFAEGNAYLDKFFPKLDRLIRAAIVKQKG